MDSVTPKTKSIRLQIHRRIKKGNGRLKFKDGENAEEFLKLKRRIRDDDKNAYDELIWYNEYTGGTLRSNNKLIADRFVHVINSEFY
jgi:hypothetical protein